MKNSIETILSQSGSQPRVLLVANTTNGQLIIEENAEYRWIRDNCNAYYSILDKLSPGRLVLPYLRTMMAALLFIPEPETTVLIGAGGGALLRYFDQYVPDNKVLSIDYDETVIDITKKYFLNNRLCNSTIMNVNAQQYLSESNIDDVDLLFMDLFANGSIPIFFEDSEFYKNCKKVSKNGIVIFNLIIDTENAFKKILSVLYSIFDKRCLCLTVANYKNIVVLAFSDNFGVELDVSVLRNKCDKLQRRYKINFTELLDEIVSSNVCIDNILKF